MEKTSEANPEKISAGSPAEVHCQLACQHANIHSQNHNVTGYRMALLKGRSV